MEGKTNRLVRLPELPIGARNVQVSAGNPPRCRSYTLPVPESGGAGGACCRDNHRAAMARAEREAKEAAELIADARAVRERNALVAPFKPVPPVAAAPPWSPEPARPALRMEVVGITLMLFTVVMVIFLVWVLVTYWRANN